MTALKMRLSFNTRNFGTICYIAINVTLTVSEVRQRKMAK